MSAVEIHHVVTGPVDAPVVILHDALGSSLDMWDAQAAPLATRFRVVRYDLRGHGGSPAPAGPYTLADLTADVTALLDRLGVARAHHVGLSLGGMIAMQLAVTAPARVDRMVLCCTAAHLPPAQRWHDRAATVRSEGVGAVADAVVDRWLTAGLAAADRALVHRLLTMVRGTSDEGYAGCCEAIGTMDLRDELASITAPTLLVVGDEDPATPRQLAEVIADGLAGARIVMVGPAAHLANVEQPDAVTGHILAHLDPEGTAVTDERYDAGMQVRREVLGEAYVDQATARATPMTRPFQTYITRNAWGEVWTRDGLDRRTRSCLTLALLAALGHERELSLHVRAAVRNGLGAHDIAEVLLHTAVYAGVPAANAAMAVAQQTLAEMGLPEAQPDDG